MAARLRHNIVVKQRLDFFGKSAASEAAAIFADNLYWFRLFRRSVHLASDVLSDAVIQRGAKQRLIASLLLGRLSTTTQAGALLVRRGFTHEAAALVRLSFEVFVLLRACCEQDGFWRRYRDSDLVRQRKLAVGGQQLSAFSRLERDRLNRSQERLEREIAKRVAKEIKIEETARSLAAALKTEE